MPIFKTSTPNFLPNSKKRRATTRSIAKYQKNTESIRKKMMKRKPDCKSCEQSIWGRQPKIYLVEVNQTNINRRISRAMVTTAIGRLEAEKNGPYWILTCTNKQKQTGEKKWTTKRRTHSKILILVIFNLILEMKRPKNLPTPLKKIQQQSNQKFYKTGRLLPWYTT